MGKYFTRHGKKLYLRIPYGEIMYGINSRSIFVWFRGKCYKIKKPNYVRARKMWLKKRY